MRRHRKDRLTEALAQLKQEGRSQEPPRQVVDETLRRITECESCHQEQRAASRTMAPGERILPIRSLSRLVAAAAIFVVVGYAVGRLSAPKPLNLDEIRTAMTPAVAAAVEPALRARLADQMRDEYQTALAGLYVHVKEELTDQYRHDLDRFAVQTLAASNALTNELLTQLVHKIDAAQNEDLRRVARALYEIEMNRVQDRTQLASGLQTLAYRTEDELSRTKDAIVQLAADSGPADFDRPPVAPGKTYYEGNKP
jgi:hypothetical protein